MTTDVQLSDSKGYYDISWTPQGDIATGSSLDTFIIICLFEEVRAAATEVAEAIQRRGWAGNESTPDFEQGSKAWEFEQARVTATMLNDLGGVVRDSLQPLIDEGIAEDVEVQTPRLQNGAVIVYIDFLRSGSRESRFYTLWDNTGSF